MGGMSMDYGNSLALDHLGNIYITGHFWGTSDFNPDAGVAELESPGSLGTGYNRGAYILKMSTCFVDNSVTQNISTLSANETNASYQWVDCNNDNAIMLGDTNITFTPIANGNYAVIVTIGNCSYISNCVNITNVGIPTVETKTLAIFPNPTTTSFTINTDEIIESISIYNLNGQLVKFIPQSDKTINIQDLPNGLYLIETQTTTNILRNKITKL